MPTAAEQWEAMVDLLEYTDEQKQTLLSVIPSTRQLMTAKKQDIIAAGIPAVFAADIMGVGAWFLHWVKRGKPNNDDITLEFTPENYEFFQAEHQEEVERRSRRESIYTTGTTGDDAGLSVPEIRNERCAKVTKRTGYTTRKDF